MCILHWTQQSNLVTLPNPGFVILCHSLESVRNFCNWLRCLAWQLRKLRHEHQSSQCACTGSTGKLSWACLMQPKPLGKGKDFSCIFGKSIFQCIHPHTNRILTLTPLSLLTSLCLKSVYKYFSRLSTTVHIPCQIKPLLHDLLLYFLPNKKILSTLMSFYVFIYLSCKILCDAHIKFFIWVRFQPDRQILYSLLICITGLL